MFSRVLVGVLCVHTHHRAMYHTKRQRNPGTGIHYTGWEAVTESSSKYTTTASSLTTLPHKFLLLSHPKCAEKLKIIQRGKRGLTDQTDTFKQAPVRMKLKLCSCGWVRMGQYYISGDKRGMGHANFGSHFPTSFISLHTADPVTHPASKTQPKPIADR